MKVSLMPFNDLANL